MRISMNPKATLFGRKENLDRLYVQMHTSHSLSATVAAGDGRREAGAKENKCGQGEDSAEARRHRGEMRDPTRNLVVSFIDNFKITRAHRIQYPHFT
jgi:hypothetical protein